MEKSLEMKRYINLYTDYGFRRIFGDEGNKDILIDFLETVLLDVKIKDLSYRPQENVGELAEERRVVFDLYCLTEDDRHIIVEMQRGEQLYLKDRSLYYTTFPIRSQGQKGKWNYKLSPVYMIWILDFIMASELPEKIQHDVMLMEVNEKAIFYDKLKHIYIETPKFDKKSDELETNWDKWLFIFRNMHKLDELPVELQEGIFTRIFELSEIAKFTEEEMEAYESSLKQYNDLENQLNFAEKKGRKEERYSMAMSLIISGMSLQEVSKHTKLSIIELEAIKKELN